MSSKDEEGLFFCQYMEKQSIGDRSDFSAPLPAVPVQDQLGQAIVRDGLSKVAGFLGESTHALLTRSVELPSEARALLGDSLTAHLYRILASAPETPDQIESWANQVERLIQDQVLRLGTFRNFTANLAKEPDSHSLRFNHYRKARSLPLSQLSRCFDWNWAPVSNEEKDQKIFEQLKVAYVKSELGKLLGSFRKIAGSQAYRTLGSEMDVASWVAREEGRPLELFVRDCLARSGHSCVRAPLHEDVLEATDLRLTLPDAKRQRGVRVQVSWVSDYDAFSRKRHLIPHASTVVFLCPFTLAQRWRWDGEPEHTMDTSHRGYALGSQRLADQTEAARIRSMLSAAIRADQQNPLGPADSASPELVALISDFAVKEGIRCHRQLREHQKSRPAYGSRAELVRDRLIAELREREQLSD